MRDENLSHYDNRNLRNDCPYSGGKPCKSRENCRKKLEGKPIYFGYRAFYRNQFLGGETWKKEEK